MKQIIEQVLQKHGTQQINLGSPSAQSILADEIATELKSNGLYNLYEEIPARGATEDSEKEKKSWVCQVCGLSTFETEYDYLVHPKLHLGCALKEEMKGKDIKEQYHDASSRLFEEGKNQQLESEINKLSEEIVDDKSKKYIYESPDGGKTIYRREVKKSEKEVVEDFQKMINEQKNMTENVDKDKWSGKYKDFLVKEKQVDKRMEENLKWYGNWKRDNLKNEE
jgi:hypothetical protein